MWSLGQCLGQCEDIAKKPILAQFKEEVCNHCRCFNHERGSKGIPVSRGLKQSVDLSGMPQKGAGLQWVSSLISGVP